MKQQRVKYPSDPSRRLTTHISGLVFLLSLVACAGANNEPVSTAITQLSSPNLAISGSGTNAIANTTFLFANSAGTIDTSSNFVVATFSDPNTPLYTNTSAFSTTMTTGSCTSLTTVPASSGGADGNQISTEISATGCTDQATASIQLDTTQVYDNLGISGNTVFTAPFTIDLAPIVLLAATGNPEVNGSGTPEATPGVFSIASDSSIVVAFSKPMTGATLNATLSGCGATLGVPVIVPTGTQTVAWPVTGFSGFSSGTTCILNVSTVMDAAGNPEDQTDPNLNMTITFQ